MLFSGQIRVKILFSGQIGVKMSSVRTEDDIEIISNEDIIPYESFDDSFKKANLFIESKYKSSLVELKILDIVLARIQHKKYVTTDEHDGSTVCSIKANELRSMLGYKSGSFYTQLKPVAASMAATTIGFEDSEHERFVFLPLFTLVKYEHSIFTVKINNDLKPYINPTTKFTILDLPLILKFKNKYTLKLHEMLYSCCYTKKKFGNAKLMPQKSDGRHFKVEIGISELKFTLGVVDSSTKQVKKILNGQAHPDYDKAIKYSAEKSYDNWTDFRRRIIDVAINEINETPECGMHVSFEPIKSGKGGKVYGIAFYVELTGIKEKPKIESKKEVSSALSEDEMFEIHIQVKSLIKEKISIKEIKSICEAAGYDIEKIRTAYDVAESTKQIENLVGFMIKAIKEGYIAPVNKEKKNKFNNFKQRQYNFDDYEKMLLNRD